MSHTFQDDLDYARTLDQIDNLFSFRERFLIPQHQGKDSIYLCGNSLGLQPKSVRYLMQAELDDWAKYGVEGHLQARNPWLSYHELFTKRLCHVVGAQPEEVVATNTLTVNLHLLMLSFYKPDSKRYKIIMEAGAFPSDQYAVETQVRYHGLDPKDAIIEIAPKPGSHILEESDIMAAISEAGNSLALVLFGGVNYYTGQLFDLGGITAAAHHVGALAGFDLAHAAGNVPLALHDWNVDFACWCSYKYMNSGPGGVAGIFVHQKHVENPETFRLGGWWGNDPSTRFKMEKGFKPKPTAESWQMSNAPVFNMVAHHASLDIFEKATIQALRKKSEQLTGYLYFLLEKLDNLPFEIITPKASQRRGAQLSLLFKDSGKKVFEILQEKGVIADWREPNVIRIAPVPLYNSFEDVYQFYSILKSINLS